MGLCVFEELGHVAFTFSRCLVWSWEAEIMASLQVMRRQALMVFSF